MTVRVHVQKKGMHSDWLIGITFSDGKCKKTGHSVVSFENANISMLHKMSILMDRLIDTVVSIYASTLI